MIAIVDYRAGNLTSVRLALAGLGVPAIIATSPEEVLQAERVVFPGVGAAGAAMRTLEERGLGAALREAVARGTPFLGICLGMQILFERSEEDGGTAALAVLRGRVARFQPGTSGDKVPHMGWNQVRFRRTHPVFAGIEDESEFYFVHSYYPAPAVPDDVLATTGYAGVTFASVVARDNLVATQFHPEKSGRLGLRVLENFCRWDGTC